MTTVTNATFTMSPHPKKSEADFSERRDQEHDANDGIEAEESVVDPIETSSSRQPVFGNETNKDETARDVIRETKTGEQPEGHQDRPHHKVRKERDAERIFWTPSNDEGMQTVVAVEFVILNA